MSEIAEDVGLLLALQTALVPQGKAGFPGEPNGLETLVPVIKLEVGSPVRPQAQREAPIFLVPEVEFDFAVLNAQDGPVVAFQAAAREGRHGQGGVEAKKRIGHNYQDHSQHSQDKGPIE